MEEHARIRSVLRMSPVRVSAVYLVLAALWILLSDRALDLLGLTPAQSARVQTFKGLVFIGASAAVIYFLTRAAVSAANRNARRAEDAEARYRSLVETSPDGISVQTGGVIRFANQALANILGYRSGDDLVGKRVIDLAVPSDRDAISERVRRINQDRSRAEPAIERFFRRDGSEATVEVSANPIDYEGAPGAMVIVRDIGEKLRAENALRESEERFRRMTANIPGAIFRYTLFPDGTDRVDYMSPGCLDIWEHDSEAVTRDISLLWSAIHPDDLRAMRESIDLSASTGVAWSLTWRIRTPSGKLKWLQGYGQPTREPGGVVVWDSAIFDITERKCAEEAVHAAEKRLSHILQRMSDGLFLLDADLRFLSANESALGLVERRPEDLIGKHAHEVFPYLRHSVWDDVFASVKKDGSPRTAEGRFEPLDKWFEARIEGAAQGFAIFFRDITERKRAEQRQQLMMRELDHRVKNNLAAVLAIAESSLREADSLEEFSESFVGRIRAMSSMHSLLAARRWEGVGLVSMLQAIVAPYTDAREGGRVRIEGEDMMLPSDAAPAICMTMHELATNAAKHGALASDQGRVEITWTRDPVTEDFRIIWRERGGQSITASIEPGFGLDLLQGVIPYELSGDVRLDFTPEGLDASIFVPGASMRRTEDGDQIMQHKAN
jgi:PAS domain S-box-containing protein